MGRTFKHAVAAILLSTVIFAAIPATAYAEPQAAEGEETADGNAAADSGSGEDGAETDELSEIEKQKQISYETLPETNGIEGWPQGPQVYAESAIVMDMDSGAILYGKKVDERRYPASITKLLTALIALENGDLQDEVTFSQASVDILRSDYAHIGMKPGEVISLNDAMYAMLLASANEVSYAIAESVGQKMGGGYDTFIQRMNERSAELGCTGSHWTNANGLHDEEHYTTAHDMALITSALYQHEEFVTIAQTMQYTIGVTNLVNETRTFQQHHKMLMADNENYYQYCTGGKTGYTDDSRTTLVTTAENGELRLVAVALRDDGDVYGDTRNMLDYAFDNFAKVPLSGEAILEEVKSYTDPAAYVLLPAGAEFGDLEHEITVADEKEAAGKIAFYYNGQEVGSADVTLTPEYIEEATGYSTRLRPAGEDTENNQAQDETKSLLPFDTPVMIAAVAAALVVAVVTVMIVRKARKASKRRTGRAPRRRRVRRKTGGRSSRKKKG